MTIPPKVGDYLPHDVWCIGGPLDGALLKIFTMRAGPAGPDGHGFRGYWLDPDTEAPSEPAIVTSGMLKGQECPSGYVIVWQAGDWVALPAPPGCEGRRGVG